MFYRIKIRQNEVGFLFRNQQFLKLIAAGNHKFLTLGSEFRVEKVCLDLPELNFAEAQHLFKQRSLQGKIDEIVVKENEKAIVLQEGLMKTLLSAGRHYFYNPGRTLQVHIVNVDEPQIESDLAMKLVGLPIAHKFIQFTSVEEGHKGLVFYNNQAVREVSSGQFFFWKTARTVAIKKVDLRSQSMEVQGQELMTKDKVTLRVNLSVRYRIANAILVIEQLKDYHDLFYRMVQMALREAVSAKTLEELLENKNAISQKIASDLAQRSHEMGLVLESSGIRDIILPGEMKTILNQVIEAEKRSQANMIQRREETAATRSLLNTAKLLENNPVLLRLKELEASEKIAEKVGSITVTGGLDSVFSALKPAKVLENK